MTIHRREFDQLEGWRGNRQPTKLFSAAWMSCCSAPFRVVASKGKEEGGELEGQQEEEERIRF